MNMHIKCKTYNHKFDTKKIKRVQHIYLEVDHRDSTNITCIHGKNADVVRTPQLLAHLVEYRH